MNSLELQLTADGSHTLYIPDMDEHYHSVNGAIQESQHVYIEAAFNQYQKNEIHVLELGFGTGLNAFLTALEAKKRGINVFYTTLEKYPLSSQVIEKLNYGASSVDEINLFQQIHACEWESPCSITSSFVLRKVETDFLEYDFFNKCYDVVYYDAFAPDKQSEVWNQDIFNRLFSSMNPDGILTTYCAKGAIRRMMQQAGFKVERIPGPPGKREMLRARKIIS